MRTRSIVVAVAAGVGIFIMVLGSGVSASIGEALRPAAACSSDSDCPPDYLCTSMIYMGVKLMPICIAGPTGCSSDADCPRDYTCDKGSWFHPGDSGLLSDAGSCRPADRAQSVRDRGRL